MRWFNFTSKDRSPPRSRTKKSDRGSGQKSSRSHRPEGSSGGHSSRRRRRPSQTMSLPKDMGNRSYYAPTQRNFYPPNVTRPSQGVVNPYAGYFQNHSVGERGGVYEEDLWDERGYAQELYRNQFLFFRPKKAAKYAPKLLDNGEFWDNCGHRYSVPMIPSQGANGNALWNWTFQPSRKEPLTITSIKRVRKGGNTCGTV